MMKTENSIWAARTKLFFRCVYENPYIPFSPFPKQAEMILATEKEVLIGGAAGGSAPCRHAAVRGLCRAGNGGDAALQTGGHADGAVRPGAARAVSAAVPAGKSRRGAL